MGVLRRATAISRSRTARTRYGVRVAILVAQVAPRCAPTRLLVIRLTTIIQCGASAAAGTAAIRAGRAVATTDRVSVVLTMTACRRGTRTPRSAREGGTQHRPGRSCSRGPRRRHPRRMPPATAGSRSPPSRTRERPPRSRHRSFPGAHHNQPKRLTPPGCVCRYAARGMTGRA